MKSAAHGLNSTQLKAFSSYIDAAKNIIICSHENPDADAYGSTGALSLILKELAKNIVLLNSSKLNDTFAFLPEATSVSNVIPQGFQADLIIFCDCGSFERIGESLIPSIKALGAVPILNIDHHASNTLFGNENIVITQASSTAEVICAIAYELGLKVTADAATAIYAGIISDSGSFRYSCVRPYTFEAAAFCLEKGTVPAKVAEQLFSNNSLAQVKLHAQALQEMELHFSGKVALITSSDQIIKENAAILSDSEGLAEKGRDISGVIVSILFKEDCSQPKPLWRISLRTKSDKIDLSALAQKFGGGGHKAAAAFRSSKNKDEIVSALLSELDKILKDNS